MLFAASLGCVALLGYFLVSFFQVYATGRDDQVRSVDAIVVMGAAQYDGRPSPQLAARLDHVAELWPQGFAPVVVVTGGNQAGDRFTEAEASTTYLVERGVPEASIVLEDRGTTSFESLERVAHLLAESTGSNDSSVLVVTDPYHSLRSRLIADEVGMTAYVSPTTTSVVTGVGSFERHFWEAGGVALGRVMGFGRLCEHTD
ncbi:MAG: YdcF family protein [Acidimicrobiales bacterium]